ncbi:MAG: hypothetical protein SFX18_20375 [Pirellulales bacterium]|nr:hypothetical protein [Pirellulales bacterium]
MKSIFTNRPGAYGFGNVLQPCKKAKSKPLDKVQTGISGTERQNTLKEQGKFNKKQLNAFRNSQLPNPRQP